MAINIKTEVVYILDTFNTLCRNVIKSLFHFCNGFKFTDSSKYKIVNSPITNSDSVGLKEYIE